MTEAFLHGQEFIELNDGIRPVKINKSAVVGVIGTAPDADPDLWPLDQPKLILNEPRKAATLGASGTLLASIKQVFAEGGGAIVVSRVDHTGDAAAVLNRVVGDVTAKTGVNALLGSSALGVRPKTLIAPGFTSQRPGAAANPVVQALLPIARKLRARIYADTPATSYEDALAWREDFASDRLVPFYPNVLVWDGVAKAYASRPASASMAGLTARVHRDFGFWYSPSNHVLQGVGGVSAPIDWSSGDVDCEANVLNEHGIATIINMGGDSAGWRRWGNRNLADDPLWAFESVRTTLDMVYEAIDEAQRWATDRPITPQVLLDAAQQVQRFFDYGKHIGFLIGGRIWLDPEKNTPEQIKAGKWSWDIDPEAPAPMEHIKYYCHRDGDGYYTAMVDELQALLVPQLGA
jgi:phage tail sheath protein FI